MVAFALNNAIQLFSKEKIILGELFYLQILESK